MTTLLEIDREFQALCPPLQAEEREQLEASLLAEGCREPLCVWLERYELAYCQVCDEAMPVSFDDGRWVCETCSRAVVEAETLWLLDGHNRYTICRQHNIPFQTQSIALDSREEAVNWIIANQLGRRNLTPEQKSYLRGKRYTSDKQSKISTKTRGIGPRLAQEYNVDPKTIYNDRDFATAVDTLDTQVRQDIRDSILRRQDREQGKITKQQAMHTGKLVQEEKVTQQPFMQREGWKPYHVLHAIELLGKIPLEHHPALNTMLDQPFTPATDGLTLLEKVAAMNAKGQALISTLALSDNPADRSDAITLALKIPTEPDKQTIIAQRLIHVLESVRSQQRRSWINNFPETPWQEDLEAIDTMMAAIQDRWRSIAASIKSARAERVDSYAATLTDE